MNLLLDTCTFLWYVEEPSRIPAAVLSRISSVSETVYVSSVSSFEIGQKHSSGRLELSIPLSAYVTKNRHLHGFAHLPFTEEAAFHAWQLPDLHKDPFDRMLIGQAVAEGLVLVTPDPMIRMYPVRVLWEV